MVKVLAGIVTFNPEIDRLQENIEGIIPQVDKLIIVDNGSKNLVDFSKEINSEITIIPFKNNEGIARALNEIGNYAVENDYDFFYTLDQDSVAQPGVIAELLKYKDLPNVGLLNSYQKDRNDSVPAMNKEVVENKRMITSGSLMDTSLFEEGFKFDSSLFVDKVDNDLDIRLLKAGYHLYQIPYYGLLQEAGNVTYHNFFGMKVKTYNYGPFRRYYISRNTVILMKKYGINKMTFRFFAEDIGKQLKILLFEENKKEKFKSFFRGYYDGIRRTER